MTDTQNSKDQLINETKVLRQKLSLLNEPQKNILNTGSNKLKPKERDNSFTMLMEQSPSVIEIYDLNGLQISVNRAYEEMWGFPASITVDKFNVLKSNEVINNGLIQYVHRAYNGETVTIPEHEFDPKGKTESDGHGRNRWLSTKIFPLKNTKGKVTNIVITHEDVTDRKETERKIEVVLEREKSLANIIREAPIAFAINYSDGRLKNCNKAFSELTGYSLNELQKTNWNKLLTPSKWEIQESLMLKKLTINNTIVTYEKEYIHKNGTIIPVELTVMGKFPNGKSAYMMAFIKDITERKQSELKTKKHHEQLEELVKERTKDLEAKNKELDNALKVFVGRELTIRDLQATIKKLKGAGEHKNL